MYDDCSVIGILLKNLNQLLSKYEIYNGDIIEGSAMPDLKVERDSQVFRICGEYYDKVELFWDKYFTPEMIYPEESGLPPLFKIKKPYEELCKIYIKSCSSFSKYPHIIINVEALDKYTQYITDKVFPMEEKLVESKAKPIEKPIESKEEPIESEAKPIESIAKRPKYEDP